MRYFKSESCYHVYTQIGKGFRKDYGEFIKRRVNVDPLISVSGSCSGWIIKCQCLLLNYYPTNTKGGQHV